MEKEIIQRISVVRIGATLALLTLMVGFVLGGIFGGAESKIKGHLQAEAQAVSDTVYQGDAAKMKATTAKAWVYFKRAHLHANGLGAISLAAILLLAWLTAAESIKSITAISLGLGSLGYSLYWMFAALKAPGLGSTGAAKEALSLLAIPSALLCILGLGSVLVIFINTMFFKKS